MHCLIVGYGSIGKRHAAILKNLQCDVSLVTQQTVEDYRSYHSIEDALNQHNCFDYVVLSNATHAHYASLMSLHQRDFQGIVLVEKPLFSNEECLLEKKTENIFVAYNLRFCALLQEAKKIIANDKLLTFSVYVGSYLPSWRKNTDYRDCYSAKKEQGGGVLRDLSHELDYITLFCGPCIQVAALGGHYSSLEINSDDVYSIIMKNKLCSNVSLHLNYLDRRTRRELIMNTDKQTICIDLVNGILYVNGQENYSVSDRSQTYIEQHKAILNNDFRRCCTYEEGMYLMRLIAAIENANISGTWVTVST